MRRVMFYVFVSVLCVSCGTARAGVAYPDPGGGWKYVYTGDAAAAGSGGYTAMDGTWSHDNGSDEWDGTAIGLGKPGGATASGGYLRLQDTGDPRDYGNGDPGSSRKIMFGHSVTADLGEDSAKRIVDAVTLSFRARVATGSPLDDMQGDTGGDGENKGIAGPWPAGGNGYLGHDGGKGNFSIRQSDGDQIVSFSLALETETMKNPAYTFANAGGQTGLVMNNLNTGAGFDTDPWEYDGTGETLNVLPLDVTAWHEYWITIAAGGSGTHVVDVYVDGSLVPSTFNVSAGGDNDFDVSYLGMDVGATGQMGAIDVDFFAYASGAIAPVPEPATIALLGFGGLALLRRKRS